VILRTTKIKVTKETTVAAPWSVHPSGLPAHPDPPVALARLQAFRAGLHACCTRRADALVDLADALLSAQGPVVSLPQLSLEPAHRRGWGSTYAALACGRIDAERLRELLARHPLAGGQPIYAVDVSTWPRCDAECSPERGLYYHPSRHSAGQPIVAGWAFQWVCQLGFARDSWTAPVDARRLQPTEDTDHTAAVQIRALLGRLPTTRQPPLFVFDAGYDSAQLTLDLAEAPWRCWCGCAPTAASMPTRRHAYPARAAGRAATAPSSPSPTRPPGRSRPPPWSARTISTAP
jgi:DDE superfamily endonuclease